ncbi:hypothetical protein CSPX01_17171, partial [Colletotrichum filicis]
GLLTGYWHTSPYSQVLAHHHFRRRKAVLAASRRRPPSAGRHCDEGRNSGSPSAAAQWCYLRYQLLETYPRQRVSVVSLLSASKWLPRCARLLSVPVPLNGISRPRMRGLPAYFLTAITF